MKLKNINPEHICAIIGLIIEIALRIRKRKKTTPKKE
jgi:hypothetical protein